MFQITIIIVIIHSLSLSELIVDGIVGSGGGDGTGGSGGNGTACGGGNGTAGGDASFDGDGDPTGVRKNGDNDRSSIRSSISGSYGQAS